MPPKKRILFVDDEPSFLQGLRRMLHQFREQWEMTFVASVDEALGAIGAGSFDAVVSDVSMPQRSGFDLLKSLRASEQTRDISVIMLTGLGEDDLKRQALDLGAADLLSKPVRLEDLRARLYNTLRLKEYEDALRSQNQTLERMVRERTIELEESHLDIILRLAKAAEFRDEDTGNHVLRVGCYCHALAGQLGHDDEFVQTLFLASPLHDIGKIGIPDSILIKPGRLTPEERKIMERHCAIGADILLQDPKGVALLDEWRRIRDVGRTGRAANPILAMASTIALAHHEKWDGSGYPRGLAGDAIPPEARITALADVYDALCAERPYKPAFPEEKVLAIMRESAGGHFAPEVYAAFESLIPEFAHIRARYADDVRQAA